MSKRDKKIQVTPEERAALDKYQRDFRKAMPHIAELAQTAKNVHQAFVEAPIWSIIDTPKPEGAQDMPDMWSVGHAKVNYVDHIKTTEDEGTQDK